MKIGIVGKFPPIQGGVSMRTYWTAHALAARGHEVHVFTNAKEAAPPFRLHMRPQDWQRCEACYGDGSVRVHWTDPADPSQAYLPMASPFVSKLASLAAALHAARPLDVILSYYLEPYAVAGHLVADMTAVPHVVRMAGSDAGRLWRHPQLAPLYDHVLRRADIVLAAGAVAERALARGVDPGRIAYAGGFVLPETVFTPEGPALDVAACRREAEGDPELRPLLWGGFAGGRPYLAVYGKLGERKGSFALLAALQRLKREGLDVGLVALAHGSAPVEARFRERAAALGLADRLLQLPFVPHWRVPELLRGALAVCCLEQDFPIRFHSPVVALEVLLCGACLVASTEVLRKLPGHAGLPHGFGCVAVEDVNDTDALAAHLAAIVREPGLAAGVGRRGRDFAVAAQAQVAFPQMLEAILEAARARRPSPAARHAVAAGTPDPDAERFAFTRLAAAELAGLPPGEFAPDGGFGVAEAQNLLAVLERAAGQGDRRLDRWLAPVRAEVAVAAAESEPGGAAAGDGGDPLFRLRPRGWALAEGEVAEMLPVRDPLLRILDFDDDVSAYGGDAAARTPPDAPVPGRSHILAFVRSAGEERPPLLVDSRTADALRLADGTRTGAEIADALAAAGVGTADALALIERLFAFGLLALRPAPAAPRAWAPGDAPAAYGPRAPAAP